jgi:metallophosphoesterase (TIGR00282 family)
VLIGAAFSVQEVEALPAEDHDVALGHDPDRARLALAFAISIERRMRLLFLGDLVGRSGRTAVWNRLPGLIRDYKLDFVIVNGENAAGGFGITEDIFLETLNAGADVVTTGNHVWDQREALVYADRHDRFLRPANYPAGTPGRGSNLYIARNGARVLVANIMGRVFMHPDLDDPFAAGEAILAACPLGEVADAVVFDFHAEATSEKLCFATFRRRAGELRGGNAHACAHRRRTDPEWRHGLSSSDSGMCGDYDSSIGMDKEEPVNRFLSPRSRRAGSRWLRDLQPICGVAVEISDRTGLAERIAPLRIGPRLPRHTRSSGASSGRSHAGSGAPMRISISRLASAVSRSADELAERLAPDQHGRVKASMSTAGGTSTRKPSKVLMSPMR